MVAEAAKAFARPSGAAVGETLGEFRDDKRGRRGRNSWRVPLRQAGPPWAKLLASSATTSGAAGGETLGEFRDDKTTDSVPGWQSGLVAGFY